MEIQWIKNDHFTITYVEISERKKAKVRNVIMWPE